MFARETLINFGDPLTERRHDIRTLAEACTSRNEDLDEHRHAEESRRAKKNALGTTAESPRTGFAGVL